MLSDEEAVSRSEKNAKEIFLFMVFTQVFLLIGDPEPNTRVRPPEDNPMFSLGDIVDLAIQIEKNGESVYRKALKRMKDGELASLLQKLANDEEEHAKWFSAMRKSVNRDNIDPQLEEMGRKILQTTLGEQTFSLREIDFTKVKVLNQLVELAIEFEQDTIIFYEMLRSFIEDQETGNKLIEIINEENRHVRILQEILHGGSIDPT